MPRQIKTHLSSFNKALEFGSSMPISSFSPEQTKFNQRPAQLIRHQSHQCRLVDGYAYSKRAKYNQIRLVNLYILLSRLGSACFCLNLIYEDHTEVATAMNPSLRVHIFINLLPNPAESRY